MAISLLQKYKKKYDWQNIYIQTFNELMKYIKLFNNKTDYTNYMEGDGKIILPNVSLINGETKKMAYKKKYPIRFYTEELDSDFRRMESNVFSMELIDFYNKNCIVNSNNSYLPQELILNKYFIDDSPVIGMHVDKSAISDVIIIELQDYTMISGSVLCLLQIVSKPGIPIGTIDVMVN